MPPACPKIYHAAHLLFTNPSIDMNDAMILAKYSKKDLKSRRIRQAISKKKNRLKEAALSQQKSTNLPPAQVSVSVGKNSTLSSVTLDNSNKTTTSKKRGSETIVTNSTQTKRQKLKRLPQTRATAKVHIAKASYRTPNQVMKADIERNENLAKLQTAYAWAVSKKDEYKNKVELADKASETFNVRIVPQTLRKLIREGRSQIMQSGPKRKMPKEDLDALSSALNTWLAIGQINGDPERKTEDMLRAIDEVIKNKKIVKSWTIYQHYKKENAALLQLSKEEVQEYRRIMWTTHANLSDWFDAWEVFCVSQGFATKNSNGEVLFTEEQMRRIINVDETNFSLDGSDGGRGGRPANTITISNAARPGTGQNKSSISSSLMLGSNSAGESMPIHIMFASKAKEEQNYQINPEWILGIPRVRGIFGHEEEKSFPATVTVNPKGGTDSRVLMQYLNSVMATLFPNASDTPGRRVLFKIDGGPGRLDIQSLAQLRAKGCYLFPGVQNTTHVTQETDRNYGQFKSLLRKYLQQLMNDVHANYKRQQQAREQQENQENLPPLELPKLTQKMYGAILGGMEADEENGIRAIPNIFAATFNKEANLRSWSLCGAVPLTRSALQHRNVRPEIVVTEESSDGQQPAVFEDFSTFDWANFTLDEMERLNKASCARLNELGYNGGELIAKVNRRPKNLTSRLTADAPLEQRVKEIVRGGISLSSAQHA